MSPKYDPNPAHHWAILDIFPYDTDTGVDITLYTDKPAHLTEYWLFYAPKGIRWHRLIRGIIVYCLKKWRFNQPYSIEQAEPGDTTTHTFYNTPWPVCQKRWFCFAGTIGGVATLATGPIFKYHHVAPVYGPPITAKFYPTLDGSGVAADGFAAHTHATDSWALLRAGPGNWSADWTLLLFVDISSAWTSDYFANIARSPVNFDTRLLPAGSLLLEAKVFFNLNDKRDGLLIQPSLALVQGTDYYPGSIVDSDFSNISHSAIGDKIPYSDLTPGAWHSFTIPNARYDVIAKAAITKLAFIEGQYDRTGIKPPWKRSLSSNFHIVARDTDLAHSPYLEITYQPRL